MSFHLKNVLIKVVGSLVTPVLGFQEIANFRSPSYLYIFNLSFYYFYYFLVGLLWSLDLFIYWLWIFFFWSKFCQEKSLLIAVILCNGLWLIWQSTPTVVFFDGEQLFNYNLDNFDAWYVINSIKIKYLHFYFVFINK